MMLSQDEIVNVLTEEDFDSSGSEHVFGLSKYKRAKWPGGIVPYTVDESASTYDFVLIEAMLGQGRADRTEKCTQKDRSIN